MKKHTSVFYLCLILVLIVAGCTPPATPTAISRTNDLSISFLYPGATTEIEMGNPLKSIIKVTDAQGGIVKDARVTLSLSDPKGRLIASQSAIFGAGDVYRTDSLPIPHKDQEGTWTVAVNAEAGTHTGIVTQTFQVKNSLSETLMDKYGFWIDMPTLKGIVPSLFQEEGDAHNGMIVVGGTLPTQHVFVENWVEVQWREGDFKLATEQDVRSFIEDTLGNPGVYWLRSLISIQHTTFKNWDAWLVKARGQLSRYDEQWMIFYAPEVDKTYAIGTTVVLPPVGIDAHAALRDGFEVHPEIQAHGVAPKPLALLQPPIELVSPDLGTRFVGIDQPIVLKWKPVKDLPDNEYYLVSVDYDYEEANMLKQYATRDPQFTLPESLYQSPNCGVFNWTVTLMKQTGVGADGQPIGTALSYRSLYWFVLWAYPLGQEAPFKPLCPNELY